VAVGEVALQVVVAILAGALMPCESSEGNLCKVAVATNGNAAAAAPDRNGWQET
jgi:hypothetical protein